MEAMTSSPGLAESLFNVVQASTVIVATAAIETTRLLGSLVQAGVRATQATLDAAGNLLSAVSTRLGDEGAAAAEGLQGGMTRMLHGIGAAAGGDGAERMDEREEAPAGAERRGRRAGRTAGGATQRSRTATRSARGRAAGTRSVRGQGPVTTH